jgi:hypothetical protein
VAQFELTALERTQKIVCDKWCISKHHIVDPASDCTCAALKTIVHEVWRARGKVDHQACAVVLAMGRVKGPATSPYGEKSRDLQWEAVEETVGEVASAIRRLDQIGEEIK